MQPPKEQIQSVYAHIGRRVCELRAERTQEDLATLIALTRTSIANIERGRQRILVHTLLDLATALDVDPAELLPSREEMRASSAQIPIGDFSRQIPDDLGSQARSWIAGLLTANGS